MTGHKKLMSENKDNSIYIITKNNEEEYRTFL